jgi:hypothetical protein
MYNLVDLKEVNDCHSSLPELLGQLNWLLDDSTQLVIVAQLYVAGQREILPQRMTFKSTK